VRPTRCTVCSGYAGLLHYAVRSTSRNVRCVRRSSRFALLELVEAPSVSDDISSFLTSRICFLCMFHFFILYTFVAILLGHKPNEFSVPYF
jgi:hypothetical protein